MKRNMWLVLVLALGCGAVAGYLALSYLRTANVQTARADSPATTAVVVASRDLPAGQVIDPQDVKLVDYPPANAPTGYARTKEEVVGRGLIVPVTTNEPVLATKLAGAEAGGGLHIRIPDGMRALSVKVDEVIGVAGYTLPGTKVDVLVTITPTDQHQKPITKVILQNVEVLTTDQEMQRDQEGKAKATASVVTLLVTPGQAEELTLAATEGKIHLALRNMMDTEEVKTAGAEKDRLVAPDVAPKATPRRVRRSTPAGPSVTTYNGSEKTVTTF